MNVDQQQTYERCWIYFFARKFIRQRRIVAFPFIPSPLRKALVLISYEIPNFSRCFVYLDYILIIAMDVLEILLNYFLQL